MQYNGAANGSTIGSAATVIVTEGPQNKKIRTGVQQPGEMDSHMHIRVSKTIYKYILIPSFTMNNKNKRLKLLK